MRDTTGNALVEVRRTDHFEVALFKSAFNHENGFRYTLRRREKNVMIEVGFPEVHFSKSNWTPHGIYNPLDPRLFKRFARPV